MSVIKNKDCPYKESCNRYLSGNHYCEDTLEVCKRLLKLNWLHDNSLLPQNQCKKFLCYDLDHGADVAEYKFLKSYEKNIVDEVYGGHSLYIYSENVGNGKTSWAVRLLNAYIEHRCWYAGPDTCEALFINVPKYLIELKKSFDKPSDYITYVNEHVYNAPLVVWDEVGSKVGSDFDRETLLNLINDRVYTSKCNIFTSNVNGDELATLWGFRLSSRVYNNSTVVHFVGTDKRGKSIE